MRVCACARLRGCRIALFLAEIIPVSVDAVFRVYAVPTVLHSLTQNFIGPSVASV